jgi:hypothetical protein
MTSRVSRFHWITSIALGREIQGREILTADFVAVNRCGAEMI